MKLKLGLIKNLFESENIKKLTTTKLTTVKDTWNLSKNLTKLTDIYTKVDTEWRNLVTSHGEKREDDSYFIPDYLEDGSPNPKMQSFLLAQNELFEIEEDVNISKININSFDSNTSLDVKDLLMLDFMIEE